MVFRYKSDVYGLRIGLPFFEPEKIVFANTKTFQVWVSVFAFVVWKGCDPKWLQSLGIESDRTLEVTDCENNVVYHIFLNGKSFLCSLQAIRPSVHSWAWCASAARGGWAALTYPLLVENALPPSSIAPELPYGQGYSGKTFAAARGGTKRD